MLTILIFSCENNGINELEKTIIIASKKVECVGIVPQKCLLVKENHHQNWQYFYDSIDGFTFEEGFEYELLVLEREIKNPPQDASSIETILIKVISKVEKTSTNLPN